MRIKKPGVKFCYLSFSLFYFLIILALYLLSYSVQDDLFLGLYFLVALGITGLIFFLWLLYTIIVLIAKAYVKKKKKDFPAFVRRITLIFIIIPFALTAVHLLERRRGLYYKYNLEQWPPFKRGSKMIWFSTLTEQPEYNNEGQITGLYAKAGIRSNRTGSFLVKPMEIGPYRDLKVIDAKTNMPAEDQVYRLEKDTNYEFEYKIMFEDYTDQLLELGREVSNSEKYQWILFWGCEYQPDYFWQKKALAGIAYITGKY